MSKLDLDWLAVFDEVFKTASVSKAAERLGIAQAAASTSLNKLRAHFDDKLFARTAQGMQPTPLAQKIHPALAEVLAQLEIAHGSRATFDPTVARHTFRIGMTDISEVVLLPRLLNHLRHTAPGLHIATEPISTATGRRLEDGEVDLVIGFVPQLDAGFYQQVLFRQNFVCLVAKNHPRITDHFTRESFSAEAHAVITSSGTGHAIVGKTLAQLGVERHVMVQVSGFLSVARIVAQTELVVIVPRILGQILAEQEPVKLVEPPFTLPDYAVRQHWHERFHADAGNVWLRGVMAGLFGGQV